MRKLDERAAADSSALTKRYRAVRDFTCELTEPLEPEDQVVQTAPFVSPTKWHLAHTTWFFETFVLRERAGQQPVEPAYETLFNSYYQSVGDQWPRPRRGWLSRPTVDEVFAYRRDVDARMLDLLSSAGALEPELSFVVTLGLNHEQQHQELMLTDIKHVLAQNPLRPTYTDRVEPRPAPAAAGGYWCDYAEGVRKIGFAGSSFAFDNEGPQHRAFLDAFEIAKRPVTSREFIEFIEAGGYQDPLLWLSAGWEAVQQRGWQAPLYWENRDGEWFTTTLAGARPVDPDAPVTHVSHFEADAFARFRGARLPTEAEWEVAAAGVPVDGNFVEAGILHPQPIDASKGRSPNGMFGDVWEWTASHYEPYPGYRPPEGAIGEYNGKFMCDQHVLRGGSCVTPESHIRLTYRNFFGSPTRWQFTGIRLARDAT